MTDGPTVRVLASQLLRHAAEFFDFVADQNPDLSDMMTANQEGYRMMADRLDRDDMDGLIVSGIEGPQPILTDLAARLLADAADFFENVGEGNAEHAEQMTANAEVFRQVSDMLIEDPDARMPADA
jgi:hypothetical protein